MASALNLAVLVLAQITAVSRAQLCWEFANVAAAIAIAAVAFVAIALFFFRRRTGDPTLIYFGLFCILYAVRLLSVLASFRALFDASPLFWWRVNWIITCTILIPFALFFYHVARESFKKLLPWVIAAQMIFAVYGIAAVALGAPLSRLFGANNILVLALSSATAVFLLIERLRFGPGKPWSHEVRVLIAGFAIWLLFIVPTNLQGLGIFGGPNVEFVGFLIFVSCLGYVAASRTFANEEQLTAINKELQIARQIQASTLPQSVPKLAGQEIAARYTPMSAVAGDFYDFLGVDEKHVGILVADVTGHGVPAALIASMLKVAFAGQAEHANDAAHVLTGLNRALCGKFEEHFVTAAYLFVDIERGVMRYSAAGHPPMLRWSRSGSEVAEIEENGLMLGMFREAEYTSVEIPIHAGDRCLLYTDGAFEAKNAAQEEYGKERVKKFLAAHGDISASLFADALFEDIGKFSGISSGRAQEDDVTLIVLDIK